MEYKNVKIKGIITNKWGHTHIYFQRQNQRYTEKYLFDGCDGTFNIQINTPKGLRVPRCTILGKSKKRRP